MRFVFSRVNLRALVLIHCLIIIYLITMYCMKMMISLLVNFIVEWIIIILLVLRVILCEKINYEEWSCSKGRSKSLFEGHSPWRSKSLFQRQSYIYGEWSCSKVRWYFFLIVCCSLHVVILDGMMDVVDPNSSHTYVAIFDKAVLWDTYFYYIFPYNDTHDSMECIAYVGRITNRLNWSFLDSVLCYLFLFVSRLKFH